MIRLLAVQTAIAVLKRALAVSKKLRPRTWACLAVIQAMLAALCFWGYRQSHKKQVQPQEVQIYAQTSAGQPARSLAFTVRNAAPSAPTVTHFSWNSTHIANQPFGGTITGTGFVSGGTQVFFCTGGSSTCYQHPEVSVAQVYGYSSHGITKNQDDDNLLYTWSSTGSRFTSVGSNTTWDLTGAKTDAYDLANCGLADTGHVSILVRPLDGGFAWDDSASVLAHEWAHGINFSPASQLWARFGHLTSSPNSYSWGRMDFPSMYHPHVHLEPHQPIHSVDNFAVLGNWWDKFLPRREPPFISQPSAPRDTSLLDVLQKLALLFQSIVLATGSIVASVLGVLGYFRVKADLELKQLQIREMQIKLELLERERDRARQEAARSSIILLS